ncbi:tagatose-bisphosphate aldolase [Enterococcus columbae]|uniref:Tagatose 1,6-diphosphate aldolase n=1 Tax=Enterococcus columbae DSM 7374 = ATCC 51263 TaxID=1121865 RepID=S0KKG1_9ENTE|nr:tagatose-bisphosphate aldolase [Enterococcus columbae]EOT40523.1 tagatose 1,6-diphosphate aldolase 2 [Enterococcus columbae DSM 7374 = ATCC 51263]EOW80299.1 tagatose 1,6-diphosphate aldolase 2 [Enterococcus columbae DSM 7374 = ATCC 51263]
MLTSKKQKHMQKLINKDGIIAALAIDQRGALKKMMGKCQEMPIDKEQIEQFKSLVSEELTTAASSILLDPEFGLPAAKQRATTAGLLLAYEKTGYDASIPGRLPDLLVDWSAKRLKEEGADAVKFLLYYDVDEAKEINEQKHAFVERIGSECQAEGLPFYLELLSYDAQLNDNQSAAFAKIKPHKVIEMMREFSNPRYQVDVLKVEVPINMQYVEGYAIDEVVYTKEEAMNYFKAQSQATQLPFIFLSAGVSAELFQETLRLAKQAGSTFNGVLCGRATWANGVEVFIKQGEQAARQWLRTIGLQNIQSLNEILLQTATPLVLA